MPNFTKFSAKRLGELSESLDTHERATDEESMKRHKDGVKKFINEMEDFDEKKLKQYFDEYCADDDNFAEVEEKPKKKNNVWIAYSTANGGPKKAKELKDADPDEYAKWVANWKTKNTEKVEEEAEEAEEKPKKAAKAKSAKA